MKKYLFILWIMAACFSFGSDKATLQGDLPEPGYRNAPEKTGMFAPRLKKHLDAGDLIAFYKEASQVFQQIPDLDANKYTDEIYTDRMWICYYVANATMFKTDFDTSVYYAFRDDDDISTKASAVSCMERFSRSDILDNLSLNKKLVRQQLAIWCTRIFKDFRNVYDPALREKIAILKKNSNIIHTIDQDRIFFAKCSVNMTRNTTLESNIENYEEDFVETLVRSYPGKANDVRKFIRMAGYTDEECADLIDRTVGRNHNTEFLYQGRYGRRHDKKTAAPEK